MSTKMRRFSRREEELVDGMIQSISRNISLAESYGDEARDIGWSVFLSVYGKYPAWFLWTGAGGWARAYLGIQEELLAFKAGINPVTTRCPWTSLWAERARRPGSICFRHAMETSRCMFAFRTIWRGCRRMSNGWRGRSRTDTA